MQTCFNNVARAQEARELLESRAGSLSIQVLGETVLWLKDNVVYPSRLHNLVKYTLHELKLLTITLI